MSVIGGFIAQCEQEQLHRSGAIQGYGALLITAADGRVAHVSANIGDWLQQPPQALLGQPLPAVLQAWTVGLDSASGSRLERPGLYLDGLTLSAVITRTDSGGVMVELLPADAGSRLSPLSLPHTFAAFADSAAMLHARQQLVADIQQRFGFERVMFYRFRHDGTGEVVAEACGPAATGTYLGLRFPASDIPQIARDLYMKTPWRSIASARAQPVPLLSLDGEVADLTYADLRSVSPVHQSYMQNMGVAASVSFPVRTANQLRALISCHATQEGQLSLPELQALAAQVERYNLREREFLTNRRTRLVQHLQQQFQDWRNLIAGAGSLAAAWPQLAPQIMQEFQAAGIWLDTGSLLLTAGLVPDDDAMQEITGWVQQAQDEQQVLLAQSLSRECPQPLLTEVAGLAAVSVAGPAAALQCLLFREEEMYQVSWGGNPDKPAEQHVGQHPVAPRNSFERWVENRIGYCREWPNDTRLKLLQLRSFLLEQPQ